MQRPFPFPVAPPAPPPAPSLDAQDAAAAFAALPDTLALVLAPHAPDFTILAATDAYLRATLADRSLLGQPLFQAMSDANPANPSPTGVANLRASLETVLATRAPHRMAVQRYDVRRPGGQWEVRHWAPQNVPVLASDGSVRFVLHQVRDVTQEVLGRQALDRAELLAARTIARMADGYLLLDRRFRFIAVNPAAERLTGKRAADMLGRTHWEVFPASASLPAGDAYRRAVEQGTEQHVLQHYAAEGYDLHVEIDAYPTDEGGVAIFLRDVSERVQAEQARREADRRKDEFMATLAHELRNPLAPIRNGLQIVRMAPDSPTGARALAAMERQVTHMVRLVDDLMDVSRISRGKVTLRPGPVDLTAVVEGALEVARPLVDAAGHALQVDLPTQPVPLHADATCLVQVLGNLLNNAAKYTPRGGRITVSAAREGDEAVVRVADTGIGIPPEALGQVFDLFTQLGRPAYDGRGGLGVGLSISRRLVELHGGTLTAHSDGPGRGAVFTMRLPLPAR